MAGQRSQPDLDAWGDDAYTEAVPDLSADERRLFTQSFDLSIQTVLEQWDAKTLVLPDIQRDYVWSNARASRLIESLLLNIPIPLLYFAETPDTRWEIFDGHQRVLSVVRFVQGAFELRTLNVLAHMNGRRFRDLTDQEQRVFMRRILRAVVISADSHPAMKYEIFERLNTGSVVLNPQELRNSLFRGPFNDLVHELARDEHFRLCIGTGAPRKRMVDQELVLRFFALYHGLTDYRPPLKTFLNRYMSGVQHIDAESADRLKALFRGTTARLATTFGDAAFRFIDAAGRPLDRSPNRAIFDAQMLAFAWITEEPGPQAQTAALTAMATLSEDDRFVDSSTLATGDRSRTVARVEMMVDALAGAGLPVALPAAT